MKKVAFLTTFYEAESGYSLIGVCGTQIGMLLNNGYDPVVLVQENFTEPPEPTIWRPSSIDLRKVIPKLHLTNKIDKDFEKRVDLILAALVDGLHDAEVCITHDIVLQDFYQEHNVAMRRYAKTRPDLLWLHWIHSCPTPNRNTEYPYNCRYTPPPGYIVYPNDTDRGRVCATYNLVGQEWRVKVSRSGHAIDPFVVWEYHELTKALAEKADLLNGDVVAIYPARLDKGKQPERIVRLMAGIKELGYAPRLLVADWQSAGKRFQKYIEYLLELAASLGIDGMVNFTSRLDDRCSQGIPRRVVSELMDLSNVYVHPSRIETYSLVVHEAALRGKLLVLNYDLPVMRELYGDGAIYMDFGSDRTERQYEPSEQAFWNDEAKRLIGELFQNRGLQIQTRARQRWTPDAQWKEMAPLLYLQPIGE